MDWVHQEIRAGAKLPMIEADAVVRSLSIAMHAEQAMVLPAAAAQGVRPVHHDALDERVGAGDGAGRVSGAGWPRGPGPRRGRPAARSRARSAFPTRCWPSPGS